MKNLEPRAYQNDAVAAWKKAAGDKPNENELLVLPTGSGKTVIMALIIAMAVKWGMRVLVLARSRELVDQNRNTFEWWFPEHQDKVGSFCAGLGLREASAQVVFASVQSVFNKGKELGERRLVIIDEAHQIPPRENSQYQQLIKTLEESSNLVKLLGLTASPYRLDGGIIYGSGQQFDSVAYNVPLSLLIEEKYIAKPRTLDVTKIDLKGIRKTAGDFNKAQVENRFLQQSISNEILTAANAKNCKSVLIFASGVAHAEALSRELEELGEKPRVITGDTLPLLREVFIDQFKKRSLRFLINVECLTVGFDAPCVDMVVIARATQSPGLFLQMVGRGFRKFPGKEECWVLDYGENISRHGPIDSETYGIDTIKPPSQGTGQPPQRVCPKCFEINLASAKFCTRCNLEFPKKKKEFIASQEEILSKPTWLIVKHTTYSIHEGKNDRPKSLRVTYRCHCDHSPMNVRYISEWMCFEHQNYARRKAHDWFTSVSPQHIPTNVADALHLINTIGIAKTLRIEVKRDGKYDRVLRRDIGDKPDFIPDYRILFPITDRKSSTTDAVK